MNFYRKTIFIIIISLIATTAIVAAQTADEKNLTKQHATLIKQIKKQTKAKKVIPHVAFDGTLWFETVNDCYHSFVDDKGQLILPIDKYQSINYMPALEEGTTDIPSTDIIGKTEGYLSLYHPQTPATIIASSFNTTDILDASGNILKSINEKVHTRLYPGYIAVIYANKGYNYVSEGKAESFIGDNIIYIYDKDGSVQLLNALGDVIIDKCKSITVYENHYTEIASIVDGIEKHGVIKLDDPNFKIPTVFYEVKYKKYKQTWQVAENKGDMLKDFVPEQNYAISYRDKGEEYYNQRRWDDVIQFYKTEGIDAPWALYFTGFALYYKALSKGVRPYLSFVSEVEKGDFDFAKLFVPQLSDAIPLPTAKEMFEQSKQMLDAYMQKGDNDAYKERIEEESVVMDMYMADVNQLQTSYPQAVDKLNEHDRQVAMEIEAKNQQQAQMWGAVLNAFANALQNIAAPSTSSSSYGAVSTTMSRPSGSSSGSSTPDNSGRKAFLKGQIADWKNKLKKAEASYEEAMAGSDESWRKKKVLESKQNTINECLNMIRQYESELNSLK